MSSADQPQPNEQIHVESNPAPNPHDTIVPPNEHNPTEVIISTAHHPNSLVLPPFNASHTRQWLSKVRSLFSIARKYSDNERFHLVYASLPFETTAIISQEIVNESSFISLEKHLLDLYEPSQQQMFQSLIRGQRMQERPSIYLQRLLQLGNKCGVGEAYIRNVFLSGLPNDIALHLATASGPLHEIASQADVLYQFINNRSGSNTAPSSSLQQKSASFDQVSSAFHNPNTHFNSHSVPISSSTSTFSPILQQQNSLSTDFSSLSVQNNPQQNLNIPISSHMNPQQQQFPSYNTPSSMSMLTLSQTQTQPSNVSQNILPQSSTSQVSMPSMPMSYPPVQAQMPLQAPYPPNVMYPSHFPPYGYPYHAAAVYNSERPSRQSQHKNASFNNLQPFRPNQKPVICRFHIFYGPNAQKCTSSCLWPTKNNLIILSESRSGSPSPSRQQQQNSEN